MVEIILTVLLISFVLVILISFPLIGGSLAYFYLYKKRLNKRHQQAVDKFCYDYITEPHPLPSSGATTHNYHTYRSSSEYLNTAGGIIGVPDSTSSSTLMPSSKSEEFSENIEVNGTKVPMISSAVALQQKIFANKVVLMYNF